MSTIAHTIAHTDWCYLMKHFRNIVGLIQGLADWFHRFLPVSF